ncbi:MAG: hemolysin family protein [Hydrogenobaculum sp.]|jgi:Hemolysins and related proteins containing CBS domains
MELIGYILGIIFFILLEGLFSGSEMAILSSNKSRLEAFVKKSNNSYKDMVSKFLKNQEEFLTFTLFGYTISIVFAASLYTIMLFEISKDVPILKHTYIFFSETLVLITIIFGEIIPKIIFQKYADKVILPVIFILYKLRFLFGFSSFLSKAIKHIFFKFMSKPHSHVSRNTILKIISKELDVDKFESLILSNIVSFKERRAGEIVRPIYEVAMIEEGAVVEQAIYQMKSSGYSRLPVFRNTVNDILGYIRAFDIIDKDPNTPIGISIRPIQLFSEFSFLKDVLHEFKRKKEHIGAVVDERGVILGIITLEDVLKEIVGQISDDIRKEDQLLREIAKDKWLVDGRLEISEFSRILGIDLTGGPYTTVSGYITYHLGRIPQRNEVVNIGKFKFKIIDSDRRRILKVIVEM